jgi:hypothetical protein
MLLNVILIFNMVCLTVASAWWEWKRLRSMGVWQGVAMDSLKLKFHLGLPCPTFLHPVGGLPLKQPYCHLQSRRPAAVFYPYGHPTPYAYVEKTEEEASSWFEGCGCWEGVGCPRTGVTVQITT